MILLSGSMRQGEESAITFEPAVSSYSFSNGSVDLPREWGYQVRWASDRE